MSYTQLATPVSRHPHPLFQGPRAVVRRELKKAEPNTAVLRAEAEYHVQRQRLQLAVGRYYFSLAEYEYAVTCLQRGWQRTPQPDWQEQVMMMVSLLRLGRETEAGPYAAALAHEHLSKLDREQTRLLYIALFAHELRLSEPNLLRLKGYQESLQALGISPEEYLPRIAHQCLQKITAAFAQDANHPGAEPLASYTQELIERCLLLFPGQGYYFLWSAKFAFVTGDYQSFMEDVETLQGAQGLEAFDHSRDHTTEFGLLLDAAEALFRLRSSLDESYRDWHQSLLDWRSYGALITRDRDYRNFAEHGNLGLPKKSFRREVRGRASGVY